MHGARAAGRGRGVRGGFAFAFVAWFAVRGVIGCSAPFEERSVPGAYSQDAAVEASSGAGIGAEGSGEPGDSGALDDVDRIEDDASGEASSPPDSGAQSSNDAEIDA